MNEILLNGINVDELLQRIGELIDSKLDKNTSLPTKSNHQTFLSRNEVAKLLKISLPTLNEWTKLNWLQSYKIGNRVLYKSDEVEAAIQKVSSYKHKKYIP